MLASPNMIIPSQFIILFFCMLITVTTTSQALSEILTTTQSDTANKNKNWSYKVQLQILGSQDVYYEFGAAATLTDGVKMVQDDFLTFSINNPGDLFLISDTANNTDVRVSIN